MLWSWSVDEFPLRELNSVVREMPYTACKILLGNPEKFDDFYWGLITGSSVPLGIELHTARDYGNIIERFPYLLKPSVIVFLFICKQTKPHLRPEHCTNGITKFQKIKQKLKTEFSLVGQFKALEWFKRIADIPRNDLQSRTSLNTPRIRHNSHTVYHSFP